jgi:leucyl/phenylalanyl-tRNA--protein transferase
MKLPWIEPGDPLPAPSSALHEPNGLLAAGHDLSAERLAEAYRQGVFPWFTEGQPVLWWSPSPRMVLFVDEFKLSRSLLKTLRRLDREQHWQLTLDRAFARVMGECGSPRDGQDGTWITASMRAAYLELHRIGLAHSVEVWDGDELIGGLYGVSIGRMFFGESMFTRRTDASKVALAALVQMLRDADFHVIDCQQNTAHLASLGAREIARDDFLNFVSRLTAKPAPDWSGLRLSLPLA